MKCPKDIRECPNGWTDCELCAYFKNKQCYAELYEPEEQTDPEILRQAAEISEKVVDVGVKKSAEKIKGAWNGEWPEHFMNLSPEDALSEFYKRKTPDLHFKEPMPAGNGIPGGGSKNKSKKSKTGNKVYTDVWEGI
ncbi:hypothetical protein REC12_11415 [Desulfosporosinus sp. PR]|uniref:hypothetical protein n=1 Tax=Candidatus Desulfosporosinus nitrosoreducens TaxID=3401928 RepID=UPI0027F4267F|nr:hypothetical protein [Desulfosporosinus sp. PR]MDQ7094197.1 hypothetical protein [Desulfosporosinus sp. PR]